MLIEDVKRIVHELDQGQQLSSIGVELIDNELAILYMNSKKSEVRLEPTLRLHKGKRYQPQGDRKAKVVRGAGLYLFSYPCRKSPIRPVVVQVGSPID